MRRGHMTSLPGWFPSGHQPSPEPSGSAPTGSAGAAAGAPVQAVQAASTAAACTATEAAEAGGTATAAGAGGTAATGPGTTAGGAPVQAAQALSGAAAGGTAAPQPAQAFRALAAPAALAGAGADPSSSSMPAMQPLPVSGAPAVLGALPGSSGGSFWNPLAAAPQAFLAAAANTGLPVPILPFAGLLARHAALHQSVTAGAPATTVAAAAATPAVVGAPTTATPVNGTILVGQVVAAPGTSHGATLTGGGSEGNGEIAGTTITTTSSSSSSFWKPWREPVELQQLVGHLNWVNMVQFSRDGHVMATASKDGSVRVSRKLWENTT